MPEAEKSRVLTIEDSDQIRAMIARVLRDQGYVALEAEGGEQGLALAASERPDLILLDLDMPEMSGLTVVRRLKEDEGTSDIPVVFLTGKADEDARAAALEAGAAKYLTKPIKARKLARELRSLLVGAEEGASDEPPLPEEEQAAELASGWQLPYLNLTDVRLSRSATDLFDLDYLREHRVVPVQIKSNSLWVGVTDPLRIGVLDEMRVITGYDVKPVVVSPAGLDSKLDELSRAEASVSEAEDDADLEPPIAFVEPLEESGRLEAEQVVYDLASREEDVPVVRLVNTILDRGVEMRASDIHLQPEEGFLRVRYRVDGVLSDGPEVPQYMMRTVVARIKAMAGLDLAVRQAPQDGRLSVTSQDRRLDLRVSIVSSVCGPKTVLRIAEQKEEVTLLDDLGFGPEVLEGFRTLLHRPHGLILVTGPTGSGKSTTLYAALAELNDASRCILTVEDPVESRIRGITQLEIRERSGLTFAACLRAALRQDPDTIMVGEIRDGETAVIATQASLTGHLVLSTLHTNDAASAVSRLLDMGIQPFLVGSTLMGVLSQRLVRLLCLECAAPFEPEPEEIASLNLDAERLSGHQFRKCVGCDDCGGTGHVGRTGVYEFLTVSEPIRKLILRREPDAMVHEQAVAEGMRSLADDVRSKLIGGQTTLEEAHRIALF